MSSVYDDPRSLNAFLNAMKRDNPFSPDPQDEPIATGVTVNVNDHNSFKTVGMDPVKRDPAAKASPRTVRVSQAKAIHVKSPVTLAGPGAFVAVADTSDLPAGRMNRGEMPAGSAPWTLPVPSPLACTYYSMNPQAKAFARPNMTPTQHKLVLKRDEKKAKGAPYSKVTQGSMDRAIDDHKGKESMGAGMGKAATEGPKLSDEDRSRDTSPTIPFPPFKDVPVSPRAADSVVSADTSLKSLSSTRDEATFALSPRSDHTPSPVSRLSQKADGITNGKLTWNIADVGPPNMKHRTRVTATNPATGSAAAAEARRTLTFEPRGNPAAGDMTQSRSRAVILLGLPRAADLSFLQAVIHGGCIETMALAASYLDPGLEGYVTFTSAQACDRFCEAYPKGIDIRVQGNKHLIQVKRSVAMDVMSGVMQGYLDCGATRVVKVTGVDDEWGIVALSHIAKGQGPGVRHLRRVEALTDKYTNQSRTVTCRFASITDAVAFKAQLARDAKCEGWHAEFGADPCAAATGMHFD